jgi:hypothetical protein
MPTRREIRQRMAPTAQSAAAAEKLINLPLKSQKRLKMGVDFELKFGYHL